MIRELGILLLAAATGFCAAGDRPALAPEATEFLKWYEGYQGSFMPPDVMKAYQAHLAKSGVGAEESQRRIGVVTTTVRAMPVEFTTLHFNKIYSSTNPPFRQEPSHFVMRMIDGLKPGAALDVAMGQGRNAIYLASKGWTVTGYDIADQGLRIAQDAAKKAGLSLETVRASHEEYDYGKARWDLVVETFAFTNLSDGAYRKRLVESLKPGGMLLIEGFGGGPKNEMLEGFKDLRVVYYEDRDDVADWGMQKMRLTRLAVRKE
jgi:2-polyprenyl-3-methyl-5-hydroxy-6-metoxy-1,4-benzoquinol methylase